MPLRSTFVLVLSMLVALAPPAAAQCNMIVRPGSLGPGCAEAATPVLSIVPAGNDVTVSLNSIHPHAMGALFVSLPGTPFTISGCNVYLDPASIVASLMFMTDAAGNWTLTAPVPNDPTLSGVTLNIQATEWVAGGPINDDYATNGVGVTFQCVSGAQGCTPGFWKQTQHFDNWPADYSPSQPFASVFEDAFPGKTLLEVMQTGGGGLEALGRHTVAALLNTATLGSSYGLLPSDVIAMFNGAISSGAYESLKDFFEDLNQHGCPF